MRLTMSYPAASGRRYEERNLIFVVVWIDDEKTSYLVYGTQLEPDFFLPAAFFDPKKAKNIDFGRIFALFHRFYATFSKPS